MFDGSSRECKGSQAAREAEGGGTGLGVALVLEEGYACARMEFAGEVCYISMANAKEGAMSKRLELIWPNKDKVLLALDENGKPIWGTKADLEPRLLVQLEAVGETNRDKLHDLYDQGDNLLIKADNLLALKALERHFAGKIKCIYIDPPFNTGNAFQHYDDGLEHTIWLSMMKARLEILKTLLASDGSIYLHLDATEVHYGKVLMDEIFGRSCFQREVVWRIGWISGFKTQASNFIRNHDTILFYTKHPTKFLFNKSFIPYPEGYRRRDGSEPKGRGYPLEDTWNCSDIDRLDSIQIMSFSGEKTGFMTQKNENLVARTIQSSSDEGDWVLDSFLGSGTTAATAHKLNRRWIGIELSDQAEVFALPRLKRVVTGEDQTGISKQVGWSGGGGFRYCVLGESLFAKDKDTGLVMMNPQYTNGPLIAAVCNLEDFALNGDSLFQGVRGNTYAHITEGKVTQGYVDALLGRLPDSKSLVVYCLKRATGLGVWERVKVKRIPKELQIPRYLTKGAKRDVE